jgi:hypothetical protein
MYKIKAKDVTVDLTKYLVQNIINFEKGGKKKAVVGVVDKKTEIPIIPDILPDVPVKKSRGPLSQERKDKMKAGRDAKKKILA